MTMTRMQGNHAQLQLSPGDSVQVANGPVGTVAAVHPRTSADGVYGRVATYGVLSDDGTLLWVPDYRVTAVAYGG